MINLTKIMKELEKRSYKSDKLISFNKDILIYKLVNVVTLDDVREVLEL